MNDDHSIIRPLWVTVNQARTYAPALGQKRLKWLVDTGKIQGGKNTDKKNGEYFVNLNSLDNYMKSLCNPSHDEIKAEALEILRTIK